jgi:hypothetical protein
MKLMPIRNVLKIVANRKSLPENKPQDLKHVAVTELYRPELLHTVLKVYCKSDSVHITVYLVARCGVRKGNWIY